MSEGKHDVKTHSKAEEPQQKKRRRPLLTLLVILLALAAAAAGYTAYTYKKTADSLDLKFREDHPSVEFAGDYSSMDFVSEWTGDISPSEASLDTGSLGEKTVTYTISQPILRGLFTPSKEFSLDYTVIDTVPPVRLWSGDGTVLERGTKFDIKSVIAYGDNADPAPEVSVDGKIDMDTAGDYPLHVKVSDSSGNVTEWDLTVEVADSLPSWEDNSPRTQFTDFVKEYKGSGKTFGIDVSAWQDEIDFKAVRDAGCEFVIIRMGWSENGAMTLDKRFEENYKKAKDAGLKVGVYVFTYDNTEEQVRAVADQVIEKLGGDKLDLPVAFDWEDFGNFQTYGISFYQLNRLYDAFADQLSQSGYDCMLYGSKSRLEEVWDDTDTRPVWLAHFTDKTDYKGPYMLWQASCTGNIDGINGDVDMDILYH